MSDENSKSSLARADTLELDEVDPLDLEDDDEQGPVEHLPQGMILGGKYAIEKLLGEGANGAVYEGVHTEIGHRVAIKVVHKVLTDRDDIIQRFRREAKICGTIRDRHVGQVYDVGELEDGSPYMVMELQEGRSLGDVLEESRLEVAEVVDIARQLLRGLSAAHTSGAIHRDVKPDNVMLVRESTGATVVKLVDFGIGKAMSHDIADRGVTLEGTVVGSPDYMPPEQLKGEDVDHRVDLYSSGVLIYEAITGRMPFDAQTLTELIVAILRDEIPSPSQLSPSCPPELEAVIMKALSRDREDRYQSAEEMGQALAAVQEASGMPRDQTLSRFSVPPKARRVSAPPPRAKSGDYALETERVRTAELSVPTRSRSPLFAVLGLLLVGGVGLAFMGSSGPEQVTTTGAAPAIAKPAPRVDIEPEPDSVEEPALPEGKAPPEEATAAEPAAGTPIVGERPRRLAREPAADGPGGDRPKGTRPAGLADSRAEDPSPEPRPKPEPTAKPEPSARPEPQPAAADTKALVAEASGAFMRGQMPRARALYKQAVRQAPADAAAWRGLGMVSSRMGQTNEAVRAFKRYLALRPGASDAGAIKKKLAELQ